MLGISRLNNVVSKVYGVHIRLLVNAPRYGDFFTRGFIADDDINMIVVTEQQDDALGLAMDHLTANYILREPTCNLFVEIGPLLLQRDRVIDISGSSGIEQQTEYESTRNFIVVFQNGSIKDVEQNYAEYEETILLP